MIYHGGRNDDDLAGGTSFWVHMLGIVRSIGIGKGIVRCASSRNRFTEIGRLRWIDLHNNSSNNN